MNWNDFGKSVVPPILTALAALFGGARISIGRRAKLTDLFDRVAKEIAVRDALLKLKIKASEADSPQRISARAVAYKQAEYLEKRLQK